MANSFRPEDKDRFLRWLRYGARLAEEANGERARHTSVVWSLLSDAVLTIDKMPDQEKRWLTSGQRSGGWNMIGLTQREAAELEMARRMSAMLPAETTPAAKPQLSDYERAMDVMAWLRWTNRASDRHRLQQAALSLIRSGDKDIVRAIYGKDKKRSRQIAYEIKTRICGMILRGLREDCGIVPGEGLSFAEA